MVLHDAVVSVTFPGRLPKPGCKEGVKGLGFRGLGFRGSGFRVQGPCGKDHGRRPLERFAVGRRTSWAFCFRRHIFLAWASK